jgi:hypothetical protein
VQFRFASRYTAPASGKPFGADQEFESSGVPLIERLNGQCPYDGRGMIRVSRIDAEARFQTPVADRP